ncbi:MAG: hypothetical protein ACREBG_23875 [Pyrinomonadaceae bacterium]
MYSGVGYCKTSYAALVTRPVKRSLTICFCVLVLMLGGSSLQRGRADARDWAPAMNAGKWSETIAMTSWVGNLYTIEKSGALYRTDPTSGKRVQVGKPDFADTEFLFTENNYLYTIETDGSLYRVNQGDGTWVQVGQAGDWKDTIALVLGTNTFWSIERNGALYRTDLTTGQWAQLGKADFADTRFMFRIGHEVYIYTIEANGSLYRISLADGSWRSVGTDGDWKDTIVGATFRDRIYTVEQSGALYATDVATGAWKQIGKTEFRKAKFMVAAHDSLYTIEDGDLYRINPMTGIRTEIGK